MEHKMFEDEMFCRENLSYIFVNMPLKLDAISMA